jgi:hypothetical protein
LRNVTLRVGWVLQTVLTNGKYIKPEIHILTMQDQRISAESVAGSFEQLNETWDFMKDEWVTASQGKLSYTKIVNIRFAR